MMQSKTLWKKTLIDNVLSNPINTYLSINVIIDRIRLSCGVCLEYNEVRYILEDSECSFEYSTLNSNNTKKYAILG